MCAVAVDVIGGASWDVDWADDDWGRGVWMGCCCFCSSCCCCSSISLFPSLKICCSASLSDCPSSTSALGRLVLLAC